MLAVWQATIIDQNGQPTTGASVEVRDEETSGLATIYEDAEATTVKDNPFTNDEPFTRFYVADGEYRIKATKSGFETIWRNIQISRFILDITDFGKELILAEDASEARITLDVYSKDEVYTKDEVIDTLYPIGSFYTQYPDADSNTLATAFPDAYRPADMFGGTWVAQWDDEGIDFHTERTNDTGLQARADGLQPDQMQGHWHNWIEDDGTTQASKIETSAGAGTNVSRVTRGSGSNAGSDRWIGSPQSDGTNGTPRTGTITVERNRLVRIYKRTA